MSITLLTEADDDNDNDECQECVIDIADALYVSYVNITENKLL